MQLLRATSLANRNSINHGVQQFITLRCIALLCIALCKFLHSCTFALRPSYSYDHIFTAMYFWSMRFCVAEMAPPMRPIQSINSRPACNVRVHKDICCRIHGSKVLAFWFCKNANTATNCKFLQYSEQYSIDFYRKCCTLIGILLTNCLLGRNLNYSIWIWLIQSQSQSFHILKCLTSSSIKWMEVTTWEGW